MRIRTAVLSLICLFGSTALRAQNNTLDDVHLFLTFFRDASIASAPYGEGGLSHSDFSRYFDVLELRAQAGYDVTPNLEVGTAFGFINLDPKFGDSHSGLSDLLLTARHKIFTGPTKFAFGGLVTLPIGGDEVHQGHTKYGAFVAMRHPFSNGLVATANIGAISGKNMIIDHNEVQLALGAGAIYPVKNQLAIIGEIAYQNEIDYTQFGGGVDYKLPDGSHLRGFVSSNLGIGNGSPHLAFGASFLHSFRQPFRPGSR